MDKLMNCICENEVFLLVKAEVYTTKPVFCPLIFDEL